MPDVPPLGDPVVPCPACKGDRVEVLHVLERRGRGRTRRLRRRRVPCATCRAFGIVAAPAFAVPLARGAA